MKVVGLYNWHDAGYCVLDNVFDTNFISSLREEITIAKEMDAMDINHTHLILPSDETKVFPKHNIYELDSMVKPDLITSDTLKNCNFINTDNTMKQMIDKSYLPSNSGMDDFFTAVLMLI